MSFLSKIFKKNKKKENTEMRTIEEIKKAYEDLSEDDKKSFVQSIKDRVDESVAAQEEERGEEDSQTAKDRVDESEGEEKELEEKREEQEEQKEDEKKEEESELEKRIKALEEKLEALSKKPIEADDKTANELSKIASKWGI